LVKSAAVGQNGELILALCSLVPECVPPLRDLPFLSPAAKESREPVSSLRTNIRVVS
jgi:hypothetical protein